MGGVRERSQACRIDVQRVGYRFDRFGVPSGFDQGASLHPSRPCVAGIEGTARSAASTADAHSSMSINTAAS